MKNLTVREYRDNLALYLHMPVHTVIQVSGAYWKRVEGGKTVTVPHDATWDDAIKAGQAAGPGSTVYVMPRPNIDLVEAAATCDRCKKNPPQRKIEEDGETYKVCESCLKKSFPISRIKKLPLWKP